MDDRWVHAAATFSDLRIGSAENFWKKKEKNIEDVWYTLRPSENSSTYAISVNTLHQEVDDFIKESLINAQYDKSLRLKRKVQRNLESSDGVRNLKTGSRCISTILGLTVTTKLAKLTIA